MVGRDGRTSHQAALTGETNVHIMIATDGSLDVDKTVNLVSGLAGGDGASVTVYTTVEIPRGMLDEMRKAASDGGGDQTIDHTVEYRSDQAESPPGRERWIGDDTVLAAYIGSKVKDRTSGLVDALEAVGVEAEVVGEEGESAARAVLAAAEIRNVDVLCIGSHGAGRFDGLLGSISTKIARQASCPVLIIR